MAVILIVEDERGLCDLILDHLGWQLLGASGTLRAASSSQPGPMRAGILTNTTIGATAGISNMSNCLGRYAQLPV
jgi:hypothetical protein